jgi:hypothetical protein
MNSEWGSLRLAAKAADRERAFREYWPAVAAQLRHSGYSSWGIAQAHSVLSGGGTVNEAVEALRSDEEVTRAGRARVRRLQRNARRQGLALRRTTRRPSPRQIPCRWTIVDPRTNSIVAPTGRTDREAMNLDEVEAWLTGENT